MLQERCTAADNISLVAHLLHRSRTHLQSMLLQSNAAIVEDFFEELVSKDIFYSSRSNMYKLDIDFN